MMTFFTRKAW
jgi:hypothetical protein